MILSQSFTYGVINTYSRWNDVQKHYFKLHFELSFQKLKPFTCYNHFFSKLICKSCLRRMKMELEVACIQSISYAELSWRYGQNLDWNEMLSFNRNLNFKYSSYWTKMYLPVWKNNTTVEFWIYWIRINILFCSHRSFSQ